MSSGNKRNKFLYFIIKRICDIVLSFLALIVLSPLFLIVFLTYKLSPENQGPVIFKQERIGKNGKKFFIFKFRSMVVNADEKLYANKQLYRKYVANSYKLPPNEDPRITSFGQFLRKTSIDELPQFINILRGEMSIIGPRPVVQQELREYGDDVDEFLSVRPGAMGLWQASGRSNIVYPERCQIELNYVRNASLTLDTKIFFKNIVSIFKSDGAY
ncbi:sugar transferase [Furfurilactobacillus cerevisiae]|uniref:sugar transferase n=1 Tax=Furfurilactobacillus rossiae TaxID=231049 RepID=UPI003B985B06